MVKFTSPIKRQKARELVESYLESGELNRDLVRSLIEGRIQEASATAEDLAARAEEILSEIEGIDCDKCEELKRDLTDVINYLRSDEVDEESLGEIEEFLDEIEEMIRRATEED